VDPLGDAQGKGDGGVESKNDPLNHSWNWFKYHAEQRMLIVRFYLIVVGALGAGCLSAFDKNENVIAAIIAAFGAIISELFAKLDLRTRQLIDASKAALKEQQGAVARETGIDQMRIVELADVGVTWSYIPASSNGCSTQQRLPL
jgi:hypothetical protein